MAAKPRILVVGQAVKPTGYARVLHSLLRHLKDSFDILHFGINYRGAPIESGWRIEPNRLIGDILGVAQLPALLDRFQPSLLFMCHDYWLYGAHRKGLAQRQRLRPKVIFYCPIEWAPVDPAPFAPLFEIERLVAYTNFGRTVLESAFAATAGAGQSRAQPAIDVIPHGIDTSSFYPLCGYPSTENMRRSRMRARERLFPDRPELRDGFIVLNANRNSPRKRIDLTLKAFAEFSQGKPDQVWLYLHMGMKDLGVDVLELARRLRIEHRLLVTTLSSEKRNVSDEMLNLIYNACDVGLNTATGEGWGLVAFEHAATGAPQVLPKYSALEELWQGVGLLSALSGRGDCNGTVSITEMAGHLNRLYHNENLLQKHSEASFKHATSPGFHWKNIAESWKRLFNLMCRKNRSTS